MGILNDFKSAEKVKKRLKIAVYGPSGVGKTWFALHFPKVAVIDMEGGTDHYGGKLDFHVVRTKSVKEVIKYVEAFALEKHEFETLVIDPITLVWSQLQAGRQDVKERKASQRNNNKGKDWNEVTDIETFTQADWNAVKKIYNKLMTTLINLDMHVILIGRQNDLTETRPNGDIIKLGVKIDSEKNTVYAMDTVFRLDIVNDKRIAFIEKDRTMTYQIGNKVQDISFDSFAEVVQAKSSGLTVQVDDEESAARRDLDILGGENRITPDQIGSIKTLWLKLEYDPKILDPQLQKIYGQTLLTLSSDNAREFIDKLELQVTDKDQKESATC
ncbi:AAA family ATPase [Brevibacillus laterosporus]|uniref:AAA family ATPase n=1 Tax=Brevibacillus laterosporus TaxID=1465 RepID=UPI003D25EBD7